MSYRDFVFKALSLLLLVICLFGFNAKAVAETNKQPASQPLKVGFIMVGPLSDWGWNYQHNQGRLYMEHALHGQVTTTAVENIPESGEVERVMEKMIAQGNKVIFATSYGYLEPAARVAKRHPEIIILYVGRPNPHPIKNLGTYVPNQYEPMYVAGMIAGKMTKSNKIGYVASHPVPPLLVNLNAFTLGARSVNPKVNVYIVWTNSWSDAAMESEAARGLIEQGVDILAGHLDSTVTVVEIAEKNHLYSIGYHADIHHLAPQGWLTGSKWNWGPLYVKTVQSILDHHWPTTDDLFSVKANYGQVSSFKDNYAQLSPFGKAVPPALRKEALALLERLRTDKVQVFKGPMKDRDGKIVIPAGKVADGASLYQTNWLVPGVYGNLPKQK